jgi:hypothetical protein
MHGSRLDPHTTNFNLCSSSGSIDSEGKGRGEHRETEDAMPAQVGADREENARSLVRVTRSYTVPAQLTNCT